MKKKIFKYQLTDKVDQTVLMPVGAEILSCQMQHDLPTIWALVNDNDLALQQTEPREFRIYGTGWNVEEPDERHERRFVATTQDTSGFVWHVFELVEFENQRADSKSIDFEIADTMPTAERLLVLSAVNNMLHLVAGNGEDRPVTIATKTYGEIASVTSIIKGLTSGDTLYVNLDKGSLDLLRRRVCDLIEEAERTQ